MTSALSAGANTITLPTGSRFVRVTPLKPAQIWARADGGTAAEWGDGCFTSLAADQGWHLTLEVTAPSAALSIYAPTALSVLIESILPPGPLPAGPIYPQVTANVAYSLTVANAREGEHLRVTPAMGTWGGLRVTGDGSAPSATNGATLIDNGSLFVQLSSVGGVFRLRALSDVTTRLRIERSLPPESYRSVA